jgi:hypothetical protein
MFGGWLAQSRVMLVFLSLPLFAGFSWFVNLPWWVSVLVTAMVPLHFTPPVQFIKPLDVFLRYTPVPVAVSLLYYYFLPNCGPAELLFCLVGPFVTLIDWLILKYKPSGIRTFIDRLIGNANQQMIDGWEAYYELALGLSSGLVWASPLLWIDHFTLPNFMPL